MSWPQLPELLNQAGCGFPLARGISIPSRCGACHRVIFELSPDPPSGFHGTGPKRPEDRGEPSTGSGLKVSVMYQ
jgi:hypothetical protein